MPAVDLDKQGRSAPGFGKAAAIVVALDVYGGAEAAQRRGDRLAGPDVGVVPPRPGGPR